MIKLDPSLHIINAEDYNLNPNSNADREQLNALAVSLFYDNPSKWHFIFTSGGQQIGEMVVRDIFQRLN
jgi:hypothetical protein